MMKCLLLLSTFLVLAHGAEECMNTENSVSVTSDTDNICPMQSVTARCVVNTVSQTGNDFVLLWGCDYKNGSTTAEALFFCTSSASVIPLECNSGRVNLTWISCTCDNSALTSDATFLATRGSELLTCAFYNTSDQVEIPGTVSFGIKDPLTPVLSLNSSYIYDVEKNSFRNVTIEWSSSGNEQYQHRVSISSPNSDPVTITTSATMINVTLEIGVDYSITVTAERCSGSVKSNTSEPFLVILPVPDRVEECGAVPVYNETTLYHVNLEWKPLPENNHVAIGVTVDFMGYELTFVSNATVSTEVPVPASELECPITCQNMQSKANFQSIPFQIYIAGKNRFGIGQNTSCTESGDKIGLTNIFLNVTEFNQTIISIVFSVQKYVRVSVLCGKDRNNLMLCANAEGPFEKHAHLNTSDHYMNEFKPDTVYYYEIETESIVVIGSITSSRSPMTSSADSSLNVGLALTACTININGVSLSKPILGECCVSGIPVSGIVAGLGLLIIILIIIYWKKKSGYVPTKEKEFEIDMTPLIDMATPSMHDMASFKGKISRLPETSNQEKCEENSAVSNVYKDYYGEEIRGLCLTESMLICSDEENGRGVVIGFKRAEKHLRKKWIITELKIPRGIVVDSEETFIYVVESGNNRILKFNIKTCTYVCESPGGLMFINPRGIVVKNQWLFVCDSGRNRIQILDVNLKFHYRIGREEINSPHDIACLYNEDSKSYTLYIATNNSTIVVLEVYLEGKTKAIRKKIISQEHMGIELGTNVLRSICIVEEKYIFATEMCAGGRILCLDLNEGRRYNIMRKEEMKSSEEKCPTMLAHHGNIISYCEIFADQHKGCDIKYFDLQNHC